MTAYRFEITKQDDMENAQLLAKYLVSDNFHLLANTDIEVENSTKLILTRSIDAFDFFKKL